MQALAGNHIYETCQGTGRNGVDGEGRLVGVGVVEGVVLSVGAFCFTVQFTCHCIFALGRRRAIHAECQHIGVNQSFALNEARDATREVWQRFSLGDLHFVGNQL